MSVIRFPAWSKIVFWVATFFDGYLVSVMFYDEPDLAIPIGFAAIVFSIHFFFFLIMNKKVCLKKGGLSIDGTFKKRFISIQNLQKIIIFEERIEMYDISNSKIIKIPRICKGYYGLEKWFSDNGITIEHRNI